MRTRADYERIFGGPDGLRRIEQHVKEANDAMPPLTPRQHDALAVLFSRRIPPRPPKPAPAAAAEPPGEKPTSLRRRRIPARTTTAADPVTADAA